MRRVAYICTDPGVPVLGHKGCSVHVREMCRALTHAGFDVSLFAARRGGNDSAGLDGCRLIDLPAPSAGEPAARELESIAADEEMRAIVSNSGPFDIVYERASLWSTSPMEYANDAGAIGILELNAPLVDEQMRYRVLVHEDLARARLTASLRAAHLVVSVSDQVAAYAASLIGRTTTVHVVPNGVDTSRFSPVSRDRSRSQPFVVGFVGTLRPWHGLRTLVDAASALVAAVPNIHVLVVGDGPERSDIERRMAQGGLADRLTITGPVPHDSVPEWLGRMDVAVAPYPATDGFYFSPLKLLEYMSAGLPVVASGIGQITALIDHGRTGLLVEPGDAADLARALRRLHAEPDLRHRLGRAARTSMCNRHTWDRVLARILELARTAGDRTPVTGR